MVNNLGRCTSVKPHVLFLSIPQVGLTSATASARDLFAHSDLGKFTKFYSAEVKPLAVVMVKLTPVNEVSFSELKNDFS